MKIRDLIFFNALLMFPTFVYGACSVANLTRCLDSVCAINIGANPAARCQYCGSASAGEPKATAMKSISAGASARYTISDKELKKAPKDPGERYIWGTQLCLEKVSGCTPDDVTDNYDELIEQSCTAAGISADFKYLVKKINTKKTQNVCSDEITTCVVDAKHCGADYRKCGTDSDFDKYFSECSISSNGCDEFLASIRTDLNSSRKTMIANAAKLLKGIVESYQNARKQKLASAQESCKNGRAKAECVAAVCANSMRYKCNEKALTDVTINNDIRESIRNENVIAGELCKFYDIACERLK